MGQSMREYASGAVDSLERRFKKLEKSVLQLERIVRQHEITLAQLSPTPEQEVTQISVDIVYSSNLNLNARHVVLNGTRLDEGMVVLLKGQDDESQNGLYRLGPDDKLQAIEIL